MTHGAMAPKEHSLTFVDTQGRGHRAGLADEGGGRVGGPPCCASWRGQGHGVPQEAAGGCTYETATGNTSSKLVAGEKE